MKSIKIDSRDLPYTIDMYTTFTMDTAEEYEREYISERDGVALEDIDDKYHIEYDADGWRDALAEKSVELIERELMGDIVKSIALESSQSPRFYNYTTDSYIATWAYNADKLREWIEARRDAFNKWRLNTYDAYDREKQDADADYIDVIMIEFYALEQYSVEDYTSHMYEETDAGEYIKYTPMNEYAPKRLEEIRGALDAENASYYDISELQNSLREYIKPGDVQLLEAAGVPEQATR